MLSQGRVRVNGSLCKIASRAVKPGDLIEIGPRMTPALLPAGVQVLYEDGEILIIEKPPGLLTVATPDEREKTVYAHLRRHVKACNPRQKLSLIHI